MKTLTLTLMLMLSCGLYAQKNVYNVQHYCIDEYPMKSGSCDVSGTEYSFVFVDNSAKEVTLFLADNKMKYKIIKTTDILKGKAVVYVLENANGKGQMTLKESGSKILFEFPDRHITLKTGKSTRAD